MIELHNVLAHGGLHIHPHTADLLTLLVAAPAIVGVAVAAIRLVNAWRIARL